jgi:2-polyprenyl-3-methyl-5-hydroxy-6-metoxy-1,4-benzoquinol methylase
VSDKTITCHACGDSLHFFNPLKELPGVTSDCRPWPRTFGLSICQNCGLVQKIIDDEWQSESLRIYTDYQLYFQSTDSVEQKIFDQKTGQAKTRSRWLLEHVLSENQFPEKGSILDVGCGNGVLLEAFAELKSNWTLFGVDPNLPTSNRVANLPNLGELICGNLADVDNTFDLIVVSHVLEHVPNPSKLINEMTARLKQGGKILIQVPHTPDNAFDLLIVDHCSHFSSKSLEHLVNRTGLHTQFIGTDIVPKEITLLAMLDQNSFINTQEFILDRELDMNKIETQLTWLENIASDVKKLQKASPLGLFGTAIAANWLHGILEERTAFFVDEDPARQNQLHLGKPVLSPDKLKKGDYVYLPIPLPIAKQISLRLSDLPCKWIMPPSL